MENAPTGVVSNIDIILLDPFIILNCGPVDPNNVAYLFDNGQVFHSLGVASHESELGMGVDTGD